MGELYQGDDKRSAFGCINGQDHEYYYEPEGIKLCVRCTRCPLKIEAKRSEDKKYLNNWR